MTFPDGLVYSNGGSSSIHVLFHWLGIYVTKVIRWFGIQYSKQYVNWQRIFVRFDHELRIWSEPRCVPRAVEI